MERSSLLILGCVGLLCASCSSADAGDGGDDGMELPELPEGCDALVEPGAEAYTELLTALMDAAEGTTVCLSAGTYEFVDELSISGNGVTLRGASRAETILDFTKQTVGANGVKITGDDVTIAALTVKDTPGDGIRGDEVKNITYEDVAVIWTEQASTSNGAYGFYPVGCDGVTIRGSLVSGARDAGIYVGQSKNVLVEDSEAHGNVAGVEFENTTDAVMRRVHAHDNTAGVLIFNLPGLPVQDGKRTLAYDNIVENNNVPNFGEAGTVVATVPPGIGFMILAADDNELRDNMVRGNKTGGILIVHYYDELFPAYDDPDYNIYAEGNYVHDNDVVGNGLDPDGLVLSVTDFRKPGFDLLYDGCFDVDLDNADGSRTNCFDANGDVTFMNFDLCGQVGMKGEDIAPWTCQHTPLMEPM